MRVKVIVANVPYVGSRGAEKILPDAQGRALVMLGLVEQVEDRPRRVYQRRDMVAEAPTVEVEPPVKRRRGRPRKVAAAE